MGWSIDNCTDVEVAGLTIRETGGDGIIVMSNALLHYFTRRSGKNSCAQTRLNTESRNVFCSLKWSPQSNTFCPMCTEQFCDTVQYGPYLKISKYSVARRGGNA